MFICSKLRQNPSETEVRTFIRIQRVIWDNLLAFKVTLSRSKLYFRFRAELLALNNYYRVVYAVCYAFYFVLVSSPPRSFFRLNHVRKDRKRCSHRRFSSQAMILWVFDRNIGLRCSCFSATLVATSLSQAITRGETKNLTNSGFLLFRWNLNMIKLDC